MKRQLLFLLILGLLVVAASVTVGACGGTSGPDQALFSKMTSVWTKEDAAAAAEVYATDAVVQWPDASLTKGLEAIKAMLPGYPLDPTPVGGATLAYVPSAKDIEALTVSYKGARFISGPVAAGRDLYMVVLEVRDGKVVNQWVSYMSRQ